MTVRCRIVADDAQDARKVDFEAVPRVGEYIEIGDGQEPYRVTRVLHETGGGPTSISIRLEVTRQML